MPALDNKPELYADLIPVWNIFVELSAVRGTEGTSPLCIAAILDFHCISDTTTRAVWYRLLIAMESTFVKHAK